MPAYWPRVRSLNPRGDWAAGVTFYPGDVVFDQGSSWITALENIDSRPPGASWWGPYVPGGEEGVAPGHVIRDFDNTDYPARSRLRFTLDPDRPLGSVEDDEGNDETVVKYPPYVPTYDEMNAKLGKGFEYLPFPPEPGNFVNPALPALPAVMGLDDSGIVRMKGRVVSSQAGAPLKIAQLPSILAPRHTVRLPTVDGGGNRRFVRINGDGQMWTDTAGAGEVIYLDGLRYPSAMGFNGVYNMGGDLEPSPPDPIHLTHTDGIWRLKGWGTFQGYIPGHADVGVVVARKLPASSLMPPDPSMTYLCEWEVTAGPDIGAHGGPGGVLHYTSDDVWWGSTFEDGVEIPPPTYLLPDPPPIASLESTPDGSGDGTRTVALYLYGAPFNEDNIFHVYLDFGYGG